MGTNPQTGEIRLTLAGQAFTFWLGTGALIELQERLREPGAADAPTIDEIQRQVKRQRLLYWRAVIWAGLRRYHADVTESQIDALLDGSTKDELTALLSRLFVATQPDPADVRALEGDGPRPTDAAPTETGRQARKRARRARPNGGDPSTLPHAGSV